jgi:hypothetical protein
LRLRWSKLIERDLVYSQQQNRKLVSSPNDFIFWLHIYIYIHINTVRTSTHQTYCGNHVGIYMHVKRRSRSWGRAIRIIYIK